VSIQNRFGKIAGVACLVCAGFAGGWLASRRLILESSEQLDRGPQSSRGDASETVRQGVLEALATFQTGYTERDAGKIDEFMGRVFPAKDREAPAERSAASVENGMTPPEDQILVLGTDPGEWVVGREAVARFIREDWINWGDVRISADDAVVNSSAGAGSVCGNASDGNSVGAMAWLATRGSVTKDGFSRPIRFTAILVRGDTGWLFRQIQFQWDDRLVSLHDFGKLDSLRRIHIR
jgi:SnoaL-like domain